MQRWNKVIIIAACCVIFFLAVGGAVPCLWRTMLGVPCPGCGMSRAYSALLTGNLSMAWQQHPLFWLPPAVLGICLFKKGAVTSLWLWIPVGALFVGTYVVRMILLFPDTPPMEYLDGNLLRTIIERIYIK